MSAATGPNPFAKTSGLTQPLNQTKAVKEYEGNINFEKEKTVQQFTRTQGRDLTVRNPYMEKHIQISNFVDRTDELRKAKDEIDSKAAKYKMKLGETEWKPLEVASKIIENNKNGMKIYEQQ